MGKLARETRTVAGGFPQVKEMLSLLTLPSFSPRPCFLAENTLNTYRNNFFFLLHQLAINIKQCFIWKERCNKVETKKCSWYLGVSGIM